MLETAGGEGGAGGQHAQASEELRVDLCLVNVPQHSEARRPQLPRDGYGGRDKRSPVRPDRDLAVTSLTRPLD